VGKPNYKFQKRQKELAKQKKKEEKRKRKQQRREEVSEEPVEGTEASEPGDSPEGQA